MSEALSASAVRYVSQHGSGILTALGQHLLLVVYGSALAALIGFVLGVLIARHERMRSLVMGAAGIVSTIPILAMFGILITVMGIGTRPVVVALVCYSILPVMRNTVVGIVQVGKVEREAALGMGANRLQLFVMVELPLAFPVIFAGLRTTIVMNFSIATYAVFIGGASMGSIIMRGMRTFNDVELLVGTVIVAVVTVGLDRFIGALERIINRHNRLGRLVS